MPDISLPEVHLPEFRLPEGLRDMNREDIQKAIPDVRLPKIELPRRGAVSKELAKELAKAGKEIEKTGRDLEKVLPRRAAPSPLPFVFFGMLAGLFIGWFLASSTVTGPRIGGVVDEVRARVARWRSSDSTSVDDEYDSQTAAFPDALRATGSDTTGTGMNDLGSGVGVGPGTTSEATRSAQGVSSERF